MKQAEENNKFRKSYYNKNYSLILNTFYFETESSIICNNCNDSTFTYNVANILIFPLEKIRFNKKSQGPVTLDDCFENYQKEENFTDDNKIFCNNCRQLSNASTRMKIYTCPEVLTINLNRGKGIEYNVPFQYSLHFNIQKYVVEQPKDGNCDYDLIGVLIHIGPSGMSGHFIAFCKSPTSNKWYNYNDSMVQEIQDPRNLSNLYGEGLPYVLFYQKRKKV